MASRSNWKVIRAKAGPFPPRAYQFVREGLAHTSRMVHGEPTGEGERHVTGQQLCLGLKDYAIRQYGLMARTVLQSWHIHSTDDFGRIVFAMIDGGFLRKHQEDSPSDFQNVYDFDEAFGDLTTQRP